MSQSNIEIPQTRPILHYVAKLSCDAQTAFDMFTVDRLIEPWLILPYGGSHADIQPKLGGKYELFWDKNSRETNSTLGCKITAFVKNRLLGFNWKGPPEFSDFMNKEPLTHVTVSFFPAPDSKQTEIHLIHSGWGSTSEWEKNREWFEKSMGRFLQGPRKNHERKNSP